MNVAKNIALNERLTVARNRLYAAMDAVSYAPKGAPGYDAKGEAKLERARAAYNRAQEALRAHVLNGYH